MSLIWFLFLSSMTLLIPVLMTLLGWLFCKSPPGDINDLYGYRTTRSMTNQETWDFANKYMGRIWMKTGLVTTLISLVVVLFMYLHENDSEMIMLVMMTLQTIVMVLTILPVENALKSKFSLR